MSSAAASSVPSAPIALKRKIAAILAADVAGYSRMVAEAEEDTLHALAAAREIFDGRVAAGGGRIFNTAGDSIMCEFDSAVEAVRVAVEVQTRLAATHGSQPPERRLRFRIGITIGDVVERGGDLLGDGVNIAARLESLAPPGGICVSRSVHEAVANKVDVVFRDIGPRQVKNIPQPVHAYLVPPPAGSGEDTMAGARTRGRVPVGRLLGLTLAFVGAGVPAWWVARQAGFLYGAPPAQQQQSVAVGTDTPVPAEKPLAGEAATPRVVGPAVTPVPAARPSTAAPEPRKAEPRPADSGKSTDAKSADAKPADAKPADAKPADPGAAYAALTREGELAGASTLPELYHNARLAESRGDRAAALRFYAALAPQAGDWFDPLLRYAGLLRPDGAARVAKTFADLAKGGGRAAALLAASSADPDSRTAALDSFARRNPAYAPAAFMVAEDLLTGRGGAPTLTERRLAFESFDQFVDSDESGALTPFFLDEATRRGLVEAARRRRGEIETFFASAATRPRATFARAETGWLATLALPEPAQAIATRLGDRGDFVPTGTLATIDPRTAKPTPVSRVTLPSTTERTTLYVTYTDKSGREAGPFPIPFDPGAALVSSARDTLERYPESWITFRPDLPNIASFAQLVTNRCAIAQVLVGWGTDAPSQPLALPPCDPQRPAAIPADSRAVFTLPDGVDSLQVKLAYQDGSESAVRSFRR